MKSFRTIRNYFVLPCCLLLLNLYYRVYIIGPESVLPAGWHNP